MKPKQSNILWNRKQVTPYEIEIKYHQMKSKPSITRLIRKKVTPEEFGTK